MDKLGTLFRARRLSLGMKNADCARRAGLSPSRLADIEAGRRFPGIPLSFRLADTVNVPSEVWVGVYLASETRLRPLCRLGDELLSRGETTMARRVALRAWKQSRRSYAGRYVGELYHLMGRIAYAERRFSRALRWFGRLESAASRSPASEKRPVALFDHALTLFRVGRKAEAIEKLSRAAGFFKARGWNRQAGIARLALANALLEIRSFEEARENYRAAARTLKDKSLAFNASLGEAIAVWSLAGPLTALPLCLSLQGKASNNLQSAKVHYHLAALFRQTDHLEDAISHAQKGLALSDSVSDGVTAALLCELCVCLASIGDLPAAKIALGRFRSLSVSKDKQDLATMSVLGPVLGEQGPPPELPEGIADEHERRLKAALELNESLFSRQRGISEPKNVL